VQYVLPADDVLPADHVLPANDVLPADDVLPRLQLRLEPVAQPLPGPLPPLAHCRAEVSSAPHRDRPTATARSCSSRAGRGAAGCGPAWSGRLAARAMPTMTVVAAIPLPVRASLAVGHATWKTRPSLSHVAVLPGLFRSSVFPVRNPRGGGVHGPCESSAV
jgi:hypothetical protein